MVGFFIGTVVVAALAGALAARIGRRCAWRHGGHGCCGRRGRRGHGERYGRAIGEVVKRRLDIDEEQEPIVDHALRDAREALRELGEELKATRATIADALRGEAVDDAALAAAFQRHDDAVARARRQVVSAVKQVHAVLEPEQRATAADLLGKPDGRWF